jgi:hypothetical protein
MYFNRRILAGATREKVWKKLESESAVAIAAETRSAPKTKFTRRGRRHG